MIKSQILIFTFLIFFLKANFGQPILPYYNSFDNLPNDTAGWSHYALSGTDDWALGTPTKTSFNAAMSAPNAWVTNLTTWYALNSDRVLVSPAFNLSDTSKSYILSFYHKTKAGSQTYFYLEYSTDNGSTWILLNNAASKKKNWQTTTGFGNGLYSTFYNSLINIRFIQGNSNVKFRFRFVSNGYTNEGWLIDNFSIIEEYYNIAAYNSDTIFVSKNCPTFTVKTTLTFYNPYEEYFSNTTKYYFSNDTILDAQDSLLGSNGTSFNSSIISLTKTFSMLSNLSTGNYYIIYKHDANNMLVESNENDNTGYAVLNVDTVFNLPLIEDFENVTKLWKSYTHYSGPTLFWQFGKGTRHHLEGTHSGNFAWHTSKTTQNTIQSCPNNICNEQSVEFPYLNLSSFAGTPVLNLWFKNQIAGNSYTIEYNTGCNSNWSTLYTFDACIDDEWDFINIVLSQFINENNLKLRIKYTYSYLKPEGIIFDDVYIGQAKSDLTIERDLGNRFTLSNQSVDTLIYFLNNCGLANVPTSQTAFYWSSDTILDAADILLGIKNESALQDTARVWTSFTFNKPTTDTGKFYIFYKLDFNNTVDEMREYNNTGYFTVYQENMVTLPYFNDFETNINNWRHNSSLGSDDWKWTIPSKNILNSAFSGNKAWVTNDTGLVSPMSRMHLYTPVFDFSNFSNPVLEFDMLLHSHPACYCFEGKTNMSYSIDGGTTWKILDTTSLSYNRWYYPIEYSNQNAVDYSYNSPNFTNILFQPEEKAFVAFNQYNSRDVDRITHYVLDIKFLEGKPKVQFRFNLATLANDSTSPNYPVEGALIDNFTIKEAYSDLLVPYKKSLMISSLSQNIQFFTHIKNNGNYLSNPGIVKFYLSNDTLINSTSFYLGLDSIPSIRPDMKYYLNVSYSAPSNLSNFKYLIQEVDALNSTTENNEINNIAYWELALDSIKNYPYYIDFNDTILNGWNQFVTGNSFFKNFRFRNMLAPAEIQYGRKSGQMFTEWINNVSTSFPTWHLTSPAFDFSMLDSICISFDLMCIGKTLSSNSSGGNLSYSSDGGNIWNVFPYNYPIENNWFNMQSITSINNEPGWSSPIPQGGNDSLLGYVFKDISFLKGKKDIVFKFKYSGNHDTYNNGKAQGMRIDNFKVQGFTADLIALDSMESINVDLTSPSVNFTYKISNNGNYKGRNTKTNFYWSENDILDINDSLIFEINENSIIPGSIKDTALIFNYPSNITHGTYYYIFYRLDADSIINETNENNNIGSFKLYYPNIGSINFNDKVVLYAYIYENKLFLRIPETFVKNPLKISVYNQLGKVVFYSEKTFDSGLNQMNLNNNISNGVYFLTVSYRNETIYHSKIMIVK